jgi:hypothetical protein
VAQEDGLDADQRAGVPRRRGHGEQPALAGHLRPALLLRPDREIVSITDKKVSRRARVTEVYEILLFPGNKITIPAVARKPKTGRTDPPCELEAMLKKHGIPKGKIVRDGHIKDYVIPPCDTSSSAARPATTIG